MMELNLQLFGGRGGQSGMAANGGGSGRSTNQYAVGDTVSNGEVTIRKTSDTKWESDVMVIDAVALTGPDRHPVSTRTPKYEVIEGNGGFTVFERGLNRRTRLRKVDSIQKAVNLMRRG